MSSLFAPFLRRLRSCASNFEYPSSFVTYEELGSTPQRAVLFAKRRLFPPFYELITHFFAPPPGVGSARLYRMSQEVVYGEDGELR